ncbi:MAG: hypothetical protein C3F02_03200 [Parcubacteria group bacterium]|nr:MAG: hypothetical protein C3F02_03200 [Parcubacteria group bacterium]
MNPVLEFLKRISRWTVNVLAVVDLGWGDGGKGKIVDWLAKYWADIIARGTGGANAGHTICVGLLKHVFHLVPAGILHDGEGKINIIGRGVAIDPATLSDEIVTLESAGLPYNGLRISHQAHLVLPIDIALDRLKEASQGNGAIGTTGRGIGPVYESHVARIGLTVNDLLNPDAFARRLRRNWEARRWFFQQFGETLVREVMHLPALGNGVFYAGSVKIFDLDAIVGRYLVYAEKFREQICDTDELLRQSLKQGKKVVLEGAQGVLLSVLHGSYPYVTSSDCSLAGLAEGVGLRTEDVDYTLGVSKAPYMTRVGRGPFPTELGGVDSARWCDRRDMNRTEEANLYSSVSLNSSDPFSQGVAIRQAGGEYGATTGRLRRVGWLDMPLLRHAWRYAGQGRGGLALTMLDVMCGCETIKVCTHHLYEGPEYLVGNQRLVFGMRLDTAVMDEQVLSQCRPVYAQMPGWTNLDNASEDLLPLIDTIEHYIGTSVDVVSVGADRDATLVF